MDDCIKSDNGHSVAPEHYALRRLAIIFKMAWSSEASSLVLRCFVNWLLNCLILILKINFCFSWIFNKSCLDKIHMADFRSWSVWAESMRKSSEERWRACSHPLVCLRILSETGAVWYRIAIWDCLETRIYPTHAQPYLYSVKKAITSTEQPYILNTALSTLK